MMVIENVFDLGQIVYLKTDDDQKARMIIGIQVRPTGLLYIAQLGTVETYHYEIELSGQIDILKKTE